MMSNHQFRVVQEKRLDKPGPFMEALLEKGDSSLFAITP